MCKSVFKAFTSVTELQTVSKQLSTQNYIEKEAFKMADMLQQAHKEIVLNAETMQKHGTTIEEVHIGFI